MLKTAAEQFYLYHEFLRPDGNGWLTTGESISSATVTVTEKKLGTDTSATMVSNVAPINSTQVKYLAKGGTAGKTYIYRIVAVTSNGQTFEDNVEVTIV